MVRPNIVYIHSHDTGRWVQPYGYATPTPNIQKLAESGMLFRQAFCAASTCSPSRAALVTGQYPHQCGMLGLAHRGYALNDYSRHIVHTLRQAGYLTVLAGIQHVASDAKVIGYDRIIAQHTAAHTEAAAFLASVPSQPFFLSVGLAETHREFPQPGPEDDPHFVMPPPTVPDMPQTRADMAAFRASVRRLDQNMGAVFDALESSGLAQNTLVICTTDHGLAFPGAKCSLTDHGMGVMLILRGPACGVGGVTSSDGRAIDAMVSHLDLFPTICDVTGIEPPPWLEGRSLMPLVRGEVQEIREEIFAEVTYHAAYDPMRCVRTQRHKYIRHFGDRGRTVMVNIDDSPSKAIWMEHGWFDRPRDAERLYDLVFDPMEMGNLAADPAHAATLADMRARLDRWMRRTNDPLLSGFVPPKPGARINHPDCHSPSEQRFIPT